MADQSMLSLFESDSTSFLEELTGGPEIAAPMQGMAMGMGDTPDMMQQGMNQQMGGPGPGMGSQMNPMQQQQQQQHPGYSQMGQMQGQGVQHPQYNNRTQMYPDSAKLHHMANNASTIPVPNQGPGGMMSPSHQPQPQQQYNSPPGHMQSPPSGYPGYPMRGPQRMTPPRMNNPQQMAMNQSGMWNRAPGTPQQGMGGSPYPNRYPNMSHQDYGNQQTPNQAQGLGHYQSQQTTTPPNGGYPSGPGGMGSPPPTPTQRLSHMGGQMGSPNPMMNMNRGHGQYPHSSQMMNQQAMGMPHMSNTQGMRPGSYPDNSMQQQQQQMNSGPPVNQNYPYPGGQPGSMGQNMMPRHSMNSDMSQYPGQNPNHSAQQYRPSYPGMGQQRPSPRPTPPPQSQMPPAQPPQPQVSSQGNTPQSSLQQLEDMLPRPASNASSIGSSFGPTSSGVPVPIPNDSGMPTPPMFSSASNNAQPQNSTAGQMSYPGQNNMHMSRPNGPMSGQPNGPMPGPMAAGPNGSMSMNGPMGGSMSRPNGPMSGQNGPMSGPVVNTSMPSRLNGPVSQMSPNHKAMSPGFNQQMMNMNMEINQLQGQIQQLYNMQQTPETQQKMLDLQERMRTLKAQQQQMIMQQRQHNVQQAPPPQQQQSQQPPQMMHPGQQMRPGMGGPQMGPQMGPGGPQQPQMMGGQQMARPPMQSGMGQQMGPGPHPQMGPGPHPQMMSRMPQQMGQGHMGPGMPPQQHHPGMQQYKQNGMPPVGQGGGQLAQLIQQASPPLPVSSMSGNVGIPSQVTQQGPPLQGPGMGPAIGPGGPQAQPAMMQAGPPVPLQQSGMPFTPQMQTGDILDGGPNQVSVQQEKANQIVADAVAKAHAQGLPVPAVVPPGEDGADASLEGDGEDSPSGGKKKKGKKKGNKKKKDPKDPKTPKTRTPRKKKVKSTGDDSAEGDSFLENPDGEDSNKGDVDQLSDTKDSADGETADTEKSKTDKPKKEKKEKKPKTPRPKPPKKKKKLPPATFLKSKKKKKKGESESDVEMTPPGSPVDLGIEKRRSERNTNKRKKYMDDIDLNLSEEEKAEVEPEGDGPVVKPQETQARVDEDTLIVEKILGVRKGKRPKPKPEPEPEDEDTEVEGEVPKKEEKKEQKVEEEKTDEAKPEETKGSEVEKKQNDESETQDKETAECDKEEPAENVKEENSVKEKTEEESESKDNTEEDKTNKGEETKDISKEENAEENPEKTEETMEVDEKPTEAKDEEKMEVEEKAKESAEVDEKSKDSVDVDEKSKDSVDVDKPSAQPTTPKKEDDEINVKEVIKKDLKFTPNKDDNKDDNVEYEEVEEFYVKYKNFSYLHCEWRTQWELEFGDRRIAGKVKRFKQKKAEQSEYFDQLDEEEYFNPDYAEVDRVLDESKVTDPVSNEEVMHYLVKWQSLPYEDSTWELDKDVDNTKITAFKKFKELPDEEDRVARDRPRSRQWKSMESSRTYKGGNSLREYQLEGVNWLTFCYYNRQNCILADEMGLGKTIQSISFLLEVYNYGIKGPFLVIVPLSTLGNWAREFEGWTDMNAVVYHGSSASRSMLQEYELFYKDENGKKITDFYKFNALITTYETILAEIEILSSIEWRACVIDEAHRLKNRGCKLLEGLKCLDMEHRVLLTGTPLQNNVDELFSLLNFLEPNQFKSSSEFLRDFGDLKSEGQVDKLQAILKPMMLRRLKEDVEKNLAAKEETIIEVELTNIQKKYYRAILERNFSFLAKGGTSALPSLMNTMMELRKCCNHPYLVNGAEENILEDMQVHKVMQPQKHAEALLNAMVQSCGKLVLIDKLLPKLKSGNHKVLIFSQMIRVLDILEDYLITKKYLYERLDGRIRGNIRQEAIDRFCRPDSDRFVFLLCTRAGGLGINLVAADTVIIYDSDWNPQNDLQAQARCHRIGQTKEVKVYRLITRNSYEREMFDKASMKLGLDKAVLKSMKHAEQSTPVSQFNKKEVEDLLKRGAYGAVMDTDNEADQFCEEDIDAILKRRTQVVQIESEGKGSTFSKASFSVSTNRSDIDIDDPNFWQKWAKKAELDVDELTNKNELIIEMPRKRQQTKRFGGQEMDLDNISDLDTSDSEAAEMAEELGLQTRGGKRGKGKNTRSGKKGRRNEEDYDYSTGDFDEEGRYNRSDCFKVEKMLLVYGYGRWEDILAHGRFKRKLELSDVELIAKSVLIYSLKYYRGDDKIKSFIWDLVTNQVDMQKHDGLAAPVPRGRKGRKAKNEVKPVEDIGLDFASLDFDPDSVLPDDGYKKHLERHNNKVLLRVRLLYYLKQEVIGAEHEKVFLGKHISEIDLPPPMSDGEVPCAWWDEDADKSLLIGTHKHGYEKYVLMRMDPALCFLSRCGPPDQKAIMAEQQQDNDDEMKDDLEDGGGAAEEDDDASTPAGASSGRAASAEPDGEADRLPFPSVSDLNTRLRKVITGYQRFHKKEQLRRAQEAKRQERRSDRYQSLNERDLQKKLLMQSKWSRREEADFYRVVSSFGVERDLHTGQYKWSTFRSLAKLDKKFDETLTEYFLSFYHMCMTVCKRFKTAEEAIPPTSLTVDPISEERANRCLARIDLLNKIRERILWHPKLEERLKLCQSDHSMPDWWDPGMHDKELLIGAAKHGLVKTDFHIQHDPKLIFKEAITKYVHNKPPHYSLRHPGALSGDETQESVQSDSTIKQEGKENQGEEKDSTVLNLTKSESKENVDTAEGDTGGKNKDDAKEDAMDLTKSSPGKDDTKNQSETEEDSEKDKKDVDMKEEVKDEVKSEDVKEEAKDEDVKEKAKDEEDIEEAKDEDVKKEAKDEDVKEEANDSKEDSPVKEEPTSEKEDDNKKDVKKVFGEEVKATEEDDDEDTIDEADAPPTLFKQDLVKNNEENDSESRSCPPDLEVIEASSYMQTGGSGLQWPKDKVIFYRLEHVCHAVEKGEWPATRRYAVKDDMSDSRCSTPAPSTPGGTPRPDDYISTPEGGSTPQVKYFDSEADDGDSLQDGRKRRRRRRKGELEAERAQMRDFMGSQSEADSESNMSSFRESLLNGSGEYSPLRSADNSPLRFEGMEYPPRKKRGRKRKIDKLLEAAAAAAVAQQQAQQQAQLHAAEILKAQQHAHEIMNAASSSKHRYSPTPTPPPQTSQSDHESRVAVVNLEDGSRLSGDEAPSKKDLDKWLDTHPNYMVEQEDQDREPGELHGRKKKKLDPNKLDLQNLTGEENVSVIHRDTGKKITGAKAPPLKYLNKWLEQNPGFDVDSKWAHIVLSKGNLSEKLKSRVLQPSGRGRRSAAAASTSAPSLTASSMTQAQASSLAAAYGYPGLSGLPGMNPASLMAAYSKMPMSALSFGAMPGMNLASLAATNPMYASMYASMMPGLFGGMTGESEEVDTEDKEPGEITAEAQPEPKEKKKKEKRSDKASPKSKSSSSSSSSSSAAAAASMHSAFPYMYNPMMFNPLYAQSLGGNFTLPSGVPTSFASLAQAQHMMNGVGDSDEEERKASSSSSKKSSSQDTAEDLSVRKSSSKSRPRHEKHGAQDLSVKKRPREDDGVEDLSVHKRLAQDRSPQDLSVRKKSHHDSPEKSKPVELNIPKPPVHHQNKTPKRSKGLDSIVSSLTKKKGGGIDSLASALSRKAEKKLSPSKEDTTSDSSKKDSGES